MNSIKSRHIVISLVVAFILFILVKANEDIHLYEYPGAQIQSHTSYFSLDCDQYFSSYSFKTQTQSNLNRHEILQTKVKGYREATYWGEDHPKQEQTRYVSDDEFGRFIYEELELKDEDIYWGAEY